MAFKLWLGNDSGNEGDASVAANWSPSGVPTTGDSIGFFDSTQAVTGGFSAMSAVNPVDVLVGATYTGDWEDYLQFQDITGVVRMDSGGEIRIQARDVNDFIIEGGIATDDMLKIRIASPVAGGLKKLHCLGGPGTVEFASGEIGDINVYGVPSSFVLNVTAGTDFDQLKANAGTINCTGFAPDKCFARGAALIYIGDGSAAAGAMSEIEAIGTAVVHYRSSSTVTLAEVAESGEIDCRTNEATTPPTFTTVRAFKEGTFWKATRAGQVTITNAEELGGKIRTTEVV